MPLPSVLSMISDSVPKLSLSRMAANVTLVVLKLVDATAYTSPWTVIVFVRLGLEQA